MTATLEPTTGTTELDREVMAVLGDTFVLAGRTFVAVIMSTIEHDAYVMGQLRAAKLLKTIQDFNPLTSDVDDLTSALILDAFANGALFSLMAGVLVERGVEWSQAHAAKNAPFFAKLTDPGDKATFRRAVLYGLLNFFLNADGSWRTFRKYSAMSDSPSLPEPSANARNDADGSDAMPTPSSNTSTDRSPSAAPTTTATGTTSFAPSPATTPADTAP